MTAGLAPIPEAARIPTGGGPARPGRLRRGHGTTSLRVGAATLWLSVIVLLPLAAILWQAAGGGWSSFLTSISSHAALESYKVTLTVSIGVTAVNLVFGLLVAWVLTRDAFPGKRLVDAVIDLPFALPTIVASLVMLALYGPNSPVGLHLQQTRWGIGVALLFVTLPFVVRSVQPVLLELDREVEEAAASLGANNWTIFTAVVLPALLPSLLSGAGLAFSRAIGEFGSVVLIGGAVPGETEVSSQWIRTLIENDDRTGAQRYPSCCSSPRSWCCSSFERSVRGRPNERNSPDEAVAVGALPPSLRRPALHCGPGRRAGRVDPVAYVHARGRRVLRLDYHAGGIVGPAAVTARRGDRCAAQRGLRRAHRSGVGAQQVSRQECIAGRHRPAVRRVAGGRGRRPDPAVGLGWGVGLRREGSGLQDHLRVARHRAGQHLRHAAVRHPRGRTSAARDRHRPGGSRIYPGFAVVANVLADHPAVHRWGLTYGIVLTIARTLGEYGAVIMVSSNLPGTSQTMTLLVSDRYSRGQEYGAYAVSTLLMTVAVFVLVVQVILDARRARAAK